MNAIAKSNELLCVNCGKPYGKHSAIGDYCPAKDNDDVGLFEREWKTTRYKKPKTVAPS